MIEVTVFTRADCHLCEQALADLNSLQAVVPHIVKQIDVDSDPKLQKEYGFNVPVLMVGPYRLKAPILRQDLEIALRAVKQRDDQEAAISADLENGRIPLGVVWTKMDQFSYDLSHHYLAFFNGLIIVYLGLAFLAPILAKVGATAPAEALYRMYSFACHQLPYRSWFLFGEQLYYPREAAHIQNVLSFSQAIGLSESGDVDTIWLVRTYEGGQQIGYKVALCQRDVAIYASILAYGLIFAVIRKDRRNILARPLHWTIWILLGILPIGLDGGTQLVSQFIPALNSIFPFRESTPFLRTLTGALFGLTSAWFAYPIVDESFEDSLQIFDRKRKYAGLTKKA